MAEPIVEVSEGKLKGEERLTANKVKFYAFRSIPYAQPPVGDFRFAIPKPAKPWEGVRDSKVDCNICCQHDKHTNNVIGDEDCLYLNVYTPRLFDDKPLPVMVYIHGGGFIFGSGANESSTGPDYLIEKDVIIVTLNYRIGIFGFLNLNLKEAPGNMGLRDQVLALQWVQKNIAKFNGDPKNVTIFGISAGGASVEYLVLSPMAKGLFHKALAQSGSSLLHWAHGNDIKALALQIPAFSKTAPPVDINNDMALYNYLKSLSAKELTLASMAVLQKETKQNIKFGYVPTVEMPGDWEPFLSVSPYTLLKKGEFTKVPYATGFTSHEGLLMLCLGKENFEAIVKEKKFVENLPFQLDDQAKSEFEDKFRAAYLEGNKADNPIDFAVDFYSDVDFIGGIYVAASLIAKKNSPVYVYEFAYDGGLNDLKNKFGLKMKGACHGDDGGYLIKTDANVVPSDTDIQVKDRMLTMWTNFAKYGKPTLSTDALITTQWAPVVDENIQYLRIDDKLTMKEKYFPERMKLYEQLYEKYYGSL